MIEYDYICEGCGHEWQEDQKITDPVIRTCPKCKKESAKRLISGAPAFHLKGSGWAKDGYKGG